RGARRHGVVLVASLAGGLAILLAVVAFFHLTRNRPLPEDPDLPLRELESALTAKEPIELVGPSGMPRWFRWQAGAGGGQVSTGSDGCCAVHSWTLSLLELLPDPLCEHYRLRVDVRHEKSDELGEVGIYFMHSKHPTALGPVDCFCQFAFNDIRDPR